MKTIANTNDVLVHEVQKQQLFEFNLNSTFEVQIEQQVINT